MAIELQQALAEHASDPSLLGNVTQIPEGRRRMRSAETLRRALGPDCRLSVAQIERAQACLYPLAQLVVALYRDRPTLTLENTQRPPMLTEAEQLDLEERAGVLEFEAGLPREEAERKAAADWHATRN